MQGDVTHVPWLFVRNPGWHAIYDQDPAKAEATRRRVYDMLAAEKMMVQGFHYPFPALAHVEKTGTGYREVAGAVESGDLICNERPPRTAAFFLAIIEEETMTKSHPPHRPGGRGRRRACGADSGRSSRTAGRQAGGRLPSLQDRRLSRSPRCPMACATVKLDSQPDPRANLEDFQEALAASVACRRIRPRSVHDPLVIHRRASSS